MIHELSLRAPGFGARNLLFPDNHQKQIPRFARDDKSDAFVTMFCKAQQESAEDPTH